MRPNAAGLSNIDRMRRMIRLVTGMLEPVSPTDTGSSSPGGRLLAALWDPSGQWLPTTSPQVLGSVLYRWIMTLPPAWYLKTHRLPESGCSGL
jgi:hypothetical protein